MSIDSWWRRLLDELRTLGPVAEEDGRLRLILDEPGSGRREIVVVMTADEWDDLVGINWAQDVDGAARHVRLTVRDLWPEQRFLLYRHYALEPSEEPEFPPDPGSARLEAYLAEHPEDRGNLRWYPLFPD